MKELPHISSKEVKKLASEFQKKTEKYLEESSEEKSKEVVKAPWGAELPFCELLTRYFEHEDYHQG